MAAHKDLDEIWSRRPNVYREVAKPARIQTVLLAVEHPIHYGSNKFNAKWLQSEPGNDFDPPGCETGLILLRRWANQDPTLERIFPDISEDAVGTLAEAFYNHRNRCQKCNETRPAKEPDPIQIGSTMD